MSSIQINGIAWEGGAVGASSYRLYDARVNPLRRRFPSGPLFVQHQIRYIVRERQDDWLGFPTLKEAVVYHGVATGFAADLIRVLVDRSVHPKGTLECLAVVGPNDANWLPKVVRPAHATDYDAIQALLTERFGWE